MSSPSADDFPDLLRGSSDITTLTFFIHNHEAQGWASYIQGRPTSACHSTIASTHASSLMQKIIHGHGKMNIIRRSHSPWASPLQLAPKTNWGWQPCSNYRCLNGRYHTLTTTLYLTIRIFQGTWLKHLFFLKWTLYGVTYRYWSVHRTFRTALSKKENLFYPPETL